MRLFTLFLLLASPLAQAAHLPSSLSCQGRDTKDEKVKFILDGDRGYLDLGGKATYQLGDVQWKDGAFVVKARNIGDLTETVKLLLSKHFRHAALKFGKNSDRENVPEADCETNHPDRSGDLDADDEEHPSAFDTIGND